MKVCFSSFTCPKWSVSQIINSAHGFGYHGVDLRCDAGHHHGVEIHASLEQREEINQAFHNRGIEAVCLSTSVQLAHRHAEEILMGRIDLAASTGFKAVRVLCGRNEDDHSLVDTIEMAVPRLQKAAEYAHQNDVRLWIETHDAIARAADAASFARQAEHESVGLLYNTLHPYRMGESVADTFEALGSMIEHVRFIDGEKDPDKVVVTPIGRGQLPLDEIFIALLRTGYDGYLCGEWFYDQYGHSADESLTRYHSELTAFTLRHGVRLEQSM